MPVTSMAKIDLSVDRNHPEDVCRQIALKFRRAIERGDLAPGAKLEGVRKTAELFNVSPATVDKAYGLLEEEGLVYRNRPRGTFVGSARLMAEKRATTLVHAFIPAKAETVFGNMVRGLARGLSAHGLDLVLKDVSGQTPDRQIEDEIARCGEEWVAGVIYYPGITYSGPKDLLAEIARLDKPAIAINWGLDTGFDTVGADEALGTALAVRHLYALGHRRMAFAFEMFSSTPASRHLETRKTSFVETCARLGIAESADLFSCAPGSHLRGEDLYDVGREQLAERLRRPDRPTGVVCYNDTMAATVWAAAEDAGLAVPEDLSIVGFDNEPFAANPTHPLTTIDPGFEEMGLLAARRMAALIERGGREQTPKRSLVTPHLIIRGSTAGPRLGNE